MSAFSCNNEQDIISYYFNSDKIARFYVSAELDLAEGALAECAPDEVLLPHNNATLGEVLLDECHRHDLLLFAARLL
jgi:hypothetical protein